ncbi:MAG: hypothetical protein QOG15_2582 [Solirubrobacteraceae bacterium]|nr:hypothetical protein [Solirubrobacteraceae bacterium]
MEGDRSGPSDELLAGPLPPLPAYSTRSGAGAGLVVCDTWLAGWGRRRRCLFCGTWPGALPR